MKERKGISVIRRGEKVGVNAQRVHEKECLVAGVGAAVAAGAAGSAVAAAASASSSAGSAALSDLERHLPPVDLRHHVALRPLAAIFAHIERAQSGAGFEGREERLLEELRHLGSGLGGEATGPIRAEVAADAVVRQLNVLQAGEESGPERGVEVTVGADVGD